MNVILFVRSIGCGGAERQLVLLANELSVKHTVTVLTFYEDEGFFSIRANPRVRLVSLSKKSRWDIVPFVKRFLSEIRKTKPDVIYAFMNTASIVALFARVVAGRPKVVWGIRSSNMDLSRYGFLPSILRRLECYMSGWADLAISNSEAGKQQALNDGYRIPITVIPNGIDTGAFVFNETARYRLRRELGIQDSEYIIGMVARHDPMKGYEVLLDAIAVYLGSNQNTRFLLVGDGTAAYTDHLKEKAEKLGIADRIIWMGKVNTVTDCYSAIDVLTSASIYGEGFSNSVGEAMSCGLMCVVTDVGDSSLIVGSTGFIVPASSPSELARGWCNAIERIGRIPHRRSEDARKRIVDNFGTDYMVRMTEIALDKICTPSGASRSV